MKIIVFLLMFLYVFSPEKASSQDVFELDKALVQAYNEIQVLHFKKAQKILDSCKLSNNHPNIYFIENYIDFYTLFIGEENVDYERRAHHKDQRIKYIKNGPKDNPYYRFGRAYILVQWALINIKFENYFTAFRDISRANKLLKKNDELFPEFKANMMILGIIHALIGTIPDNYKWAANLMGFEGTIAQGNEEIESVLQYSQQNDFMLAQEVIVLYTLINLHLKNDRHKAWDILKKYTFHQNKGPLACFILANVAMRTYKNTAALSFLDNYSIDSQTYPFHHLKLMKGMALMRNFDPSCKVHLYNYVTQFKGKSYIKEAYLYLAWQDLLFADGRQYDKWIALCISNGGLQTDEDQNAYWEAKTGIRPHKALLKARLLFDGGYWKKSKNVLLNEINMPTLNADQKVEYYYRLARIDELSGNKMDAISIFKKVIEMDEREHYLVCSAQLHMGFLLEEMKYFEQAEWAYSNCLKLNPNRYKTGLHQKAKAGLNRIRP